MHRILKVRDLSAEIRGGFDLNIRRIYDHALRQINQRLRKAFKDEKLSEVTIDLSYLGMGLGFFDLCTLHGELMKDYEQAGWKVETSPPPYLKFTFTPPLGAF